MPDEALVRCRLLGPVEVTIGGRPARAELLWRKNLALLLYLACSPTGSRTRDHLVGLLWGDKTEKAARHSLNEALRVLRHSVGERALDTSAGSVRLDRSAVWLDTDELNRLVAAGRHAEAARLVAGEFLEGFAVAGAPQFDDWVAAERLRWREVGVDVLVRVAEAHLEAGHPRPALETATRACRLDPMSDLAMRAFMRAAAIGGDPALALDGYERFAERLERDVGIAPASDTRALAALVRKERVRPLAKAPSQDAPDSRRPPLIGRETELAALLGCWRRACEEGSPVVAVVMGDPGTGKSRLALELGARARLEGGSVALARCVPTDRTAPWSVVTALARGGLLDAPGLGASPPDALAPFGHRIAEWADRFPATRQSQAVELSTDAVSAVLQAVSLERPALLVIDDAQWADRESLQAVITTLRDLPRTARLMVMLGQSTSDSPPELDAVRSRLGRELNGILVRLDPLDARAIRQLCAWALPRYTEIELDRVTHRVATDSAGLPFLAVELVNAVAHGLDLVGAQGAWPKPLRTLDETMPGELPDTLIAAVRIAFRRLSPEARQVLTVAAVAGERVTAIGLAPAVDLDSAALEAALDELEWDRWLAVDARGYSFVARITREIVAADLLTSGQRQRIRGRLATVASVGQPPSSTT